MQFEDKHSMFDSEDDEYVLPLNYSHKHYRVACIGKRCCSKLTKDKHNFSAPYDIRFRDIMTETVKHLMQCGFKVLYAHTQRADITLLIDLYEPRNRKMDTIFAAETNAKFSLQLGDLGTFDCRTRYLSKKQTIEYFSWKQAEAYQLALNHHGYWLASQQPYASHLALSRFMGLSVEEKAEYLTQRGLKINDLPSWQKRGIGIYWSIHHKWDRDSVFHDLEMTSYNRLYIDYELPIEAEYDHFIEKFLNE